MKPEEARNLPKYTPNPLFVGMPAYLKDPANFNKIQKALLETLATKHSHGEMTEWNKCLGCQIKFRNHAQLMRKLGFKSGKQYREWKKIMDIIINKKRNPLR